jgi:DNA-directed RNA polymerase specialized sigma24 family protein
MTRSDPLAGVLSNPHDRAGWDRLIAANSGRIDAYLRFLASRYPDIQSIDLQDIRQAALVRIVVESQRIGNAEAYWPYWKRILRSALIDFLRVRRRTQNELSDQSLLDLLADRSRVGRVADTADELAWYFERSSPLTREVLRDLLLGISPGETANRLRTSRATVYVLRSRIRRDFHKFGLGV